MKNERPALWSEPCANQNQSGGERSYTRFAAGRTTAISSSAVSSGRDWLAQNDPRPPPASPALALSAGGLQGGRRKAHINNSGCRNVTHPCYCGVSNDGNLASSNAFWRLATEYAAHGIATFPINIVGSEKKPAIRGW